ncbi:hypothetical protein ScPMuIL_007964 [Solemya velum]
MENNSPELESYIKTLRRIMCSAFALRGAPMKVVIDFRRGLGLMLTESPVIPILCKAVIETLVTGYRSEDGKVQSRLYQPLKRAMLVLINYSDYSTQVAEEIASVPGFMECVRDKLVELCPQHMESKLKQNDTMVLRLLFMLVHNCAAADNNIQLLNDLDYTKVMVPYLESKSALMRLTAIAVLADIVDENMRDILDTNPRIIQFLMKVFDKALANSTHRRHLGWTARETARTIRRLSRNDVNKKKLVEHGVLPLLVKQTQTGDEEEQTESVGALWSLAFNAEIQEKMMDPELGVIDVLNVEQMSENAAVSRACKGTLWTMREQLKASDKYKDLGEGLCKIKHTTKPGTKLLSDTDHGHVMISYQWDCQPVLMKVRDQLRSSGFRVWMDIDDMGGSTLQAMAEAVENSAVVLVCFSQRYKDSPNCRAEAEYAFQKRKNIVPLLMQQSYHADGWLGLIIGTKLFHDMSGKYSFESRISRLIKELRRLSDSKVDGPPAPTSKQKGVNYLPLGVTADKPLGDHDGTVAVREWTQDSVALWLDEHQLPRERFRNMTGREIDFLRNLRNEAPEAFYKVLIDVVGIHDLPTLVQFTEGLQNIQL